MIDFIFKTQLFRETKKQNKFQLLVSIFMTLIFDTSISGSMKTLIGDCGISWLLNVILMQCMPGSFGS